MCKTVSSEPMWWKEASSSNAIPIGKATHDAPLGKAARRRGLGMECYY